MGPCFSPPPPLPTLHPHRLVCPPSCFSSEPPARGLIYSATADFKYDTTPTARGQSINLQFDATEDPTPFTDAGIASFDLLAFLMDTGEGAVGPLSVWGFPRCDRSPVLGCSL